MSSAVEGGTEPVETVAAFLEQRGIRYEVVEHRQSFSAAGEALASGVQPQNAAKSVLLHDEDGYRLAVIPASERLDLHKARELLDASSHLRLATEKEIGEDFPGFELGAIPPLGPMLPAPEVLDRRLLDHEQVLCNAGDHSHSVLVDPSELSRATDAEVGDICSN
jgi:Ala-tRNA(Pro) deacylase